MKKKKLLGKVLMAAAMLGVVADFGINIADCFECAYYCNACCDCNESRVETRLFFYGFRI